MSLQVRKRSRDVPRLDLLIFSTRRRRVPVRLPCRSRFEDRSHVKRLPVFPSSVAARTAYCFVTTMLFALVVSVNPAVWVVNDPLSEPNVRALYCAPFVGGCLRLTVTFRAPDNVAFEATWSVEPNNSVSAAPAAWL